MGLNERLKKVADRIPQKEFPKIIIGKSGETKKQAIKRYEKENKMKLSPDEMEPIFIALKDDKLVKPVDIDELTAEEQLELFKSIASDEELKRLNDEFEDDESK